MHSSYIPVGKKRICSYHHMKMIAYKAPCAVFLKVYLYGLKSLFVTELILNFGNH